MKTLIHILAVKLLLVALLFTGCKQSMVISKVDYSQSIESVLTPNEEGIVKDVKHGLTFNTKPLQYVETKDTSSVTIEEVRYIRGQKGYYYITAQNFKNVYVMSPDKGQLVLEQKLAVSENGLEKPAFNQRSSYVQLINRKSGESWQLYPERIQKESQMAQKEENKL